MPAYIHDMATAVPKTVCRQDDLKEAMKTYGQKSPKEKRIIDMIYNRSGIDKRHSIIDDLNKDPRKTFFFDPKTGGRIPSTLERNKVYIEQAKQLYPEIARKLIDQSDFEKDEITHIITVSCTGFYAPGPDYTILRALDLSPSIQRYHLGFMGCYAALPALKMANNFCQTDPDAVVMVVSLELCTLHLQIGNTTDQLISASVFSDGGGGAIVSAREPSKKQPSFRIDSFASTITDEGERDMAWEVGDTGFEIVLSTYVPDIIRKNLDEAISPVLSDMNLTPAEIDKWAIHPGGRAILDKVEEAVSLEPHQIASSREILKNYGNMSSATILFVLNDILQKNRENGEQSETENVLAMAFGPGLTVESSHLTLQPAKPQQEPVSDTKLAEQS